MEGASDSIYHLVYVNDENFGGHRDLKVISLIRLVVNEAFENFDTDEWLKITAKLPNSTRRKQGHQQTTLL